MKIFLILFILYTQTLFANVTWDTTVSLEDVAYSPQWLRLLHYQPAWTTEYKSLLDGEDFFFAKDGKTNPLAELKASLEAMSQNLQVGKLKQHPQCAFPYRFYFLKKTLHLNVSEIACEKFEEFMAGFYKPKSLSIVYSSAYPNNPASMFGHLLIKVNSERNNPLMDSGINYAAAVADDENPFAFFYFGVFGGYRGAFSKQPYYVKVNEYVNFESRDLWEYELSLSQEEVKNFLAHLWEIETNSYYWYYFFDENCAYQIMSALEAIKPEWNVSKYHLAAVPGEMLKNLAFTPGAIKEVHFRPSHYKQAMQTYNALNKSEEADFLKVIHKEVPPAEVSSRLTLDASIQYIEYIRNEKKSLYKEDYEDFRKSLLSARAKLGPLNDDEKKRLPEIPKETRPDWGHDVAESLFGYGTARFSSSNETSEFYLFRFRMAYHDLLNNDLGMNRYGKIEFPSVELRYYDDEKQLMVEEVGFLKSTSLHPLSHVSQKFSWKFESKVAPAKDYSCLNCRHATLEGGLGGALNLFSRNHIAYALSTVTAEHYHQLPQGYRLGPGMDAGIIFNPGESKFLAGYKKNWYLENQSSLNASVDFFHLGMTFYPGRNWELRQTAQWILPSNDKYPQHFETFFSIHHFFH